MIMGASWIFVRDFLFRPTDAFRKENVEKNEDLAMCLVIAYGLLIGINNVLISNFIPKSIGDIILIGVSLGAGIILVMVSTVLAGNLLNWTSSVFNKLDFSNDIRRSLPFSNIPLIFAELTKVFSSNTTVERSVNLICAVWSVVILIVVLRKIKSISIWRSLLAVLLAIFIFVGPIAFIVFALR
jgi:hypothetical protein